MPILPGLLRLRAASTPAARPSRVRRARAAVVAGFAAFGVIGVLATLLAERHRLDAVDREYACRRELLRDRQAEHPGRPLLLVVGSSRTVMGFAPEQMPPVADAAGEPVLAFNFSHFGCGPILNRVALGRLFADGVRPRWVVLELMPGFFPRENARLVASLCTARDAAVAGRYYDPGELWWEYARNRVVGLPDLLRRATSDPEPDLRFGPFGGYTLLKESVPPAERDALMAVQAGHFGRHMRDWKPGPGADRAVRETVELCRANGARVWLLLSPEGPDHQKLYGPGGPDRVTAYATGLARELDVPLTDARGWLAEDDFQDSHHALKKGADKFTMRLAAEVIVKMTNAPNAPQ